MANLTTSAIIVIVIVISLAAVSLGAALTKHFYPSNTDRFTFSRDQKLYMRSVRGKTLGIFRRETRGMRSLDSRDLESVYSPEGSSSRY